MISREYEKRKTSLVGNTISYSDWSVVPWNSSPPIYTDTIYWKVAQYIRGSMYRLESLDYEGEWMYASHSKRSNSWKEWKSKHPEVQKAYEKSKGYLFPEDINLKGAMLAPKDKSKGYDCLIVYDQSPVHFSILDNDIDQTAYVSFYINPHPFNIVGGPKA